MALFLAGPVSGLVLGVAGIYLDRERGFAIAGAVLGGIQLFIQLFKLFTRWWG